MKRLVTVNEKIIKHKDQTKIILTLILMITIILSFVTLNASATFVEMEKIHTPEKINYNCNEQLQFNITITVRTIKGGSILSIKNLKIRDTLPQGLSFLPGNRTSSPPAISFINYGNGTLLWDFGAGPFTGDPQASIRFNVTVNADATENVYITNQATAFYEETISGTPSAPAVTDVIRVIYPILDINKTCSGTIHEGDGILYTVTLKNTGHQDTPILEVTDYLPFDVVYSPGAASSTSGTLDETQLPGKLIWNGFIENVTGSNTVNITIPVTDKPSIISSSILNNASYTGLSGCEHVLKAWDSCITPVIHPEIQLVKTCQASSLIEPANITYTYKVTNTGDTPLYNVTVYDETLSSMILGPFDLGLSEFQVGNTILLNKSAGTYYNMANATGVDFLDMQVESHDDATCIIFEEPPDYVGGIIEEAVSDEQRISLFVLLGTLVTMALILVFKRSKPIISIAFYPVL